MVAASLPFYEPFRLVATLRSMNNEIYPGMPPEERRAVINQHAEMNARIIWQAHTTSRGEASFEMKASTGGQPAGCTSMITIFILAFGALGIAGYKMLS